MQKIRVDFIHKSATGFLGIKSLHEEMIKDGNFIIRHLINRAFLDKAELDYFSKENIKVYTYPDDLEKVDYIVVTSPYYIDFERLSQIGKVAMIHYGLFPKTALEYPTVSSQNFLWKQFVGDKFNKCVLEIFGQEEKIVQLGHPRYDLYFRDRIDKKKVLIDCKLDPNKQTILYAPTLQAPGELTNIYSTFSSAVYSIITIANKLNMNLIIKGHPFLFGENNQNIAQKNQIEEIVRKNKNIIFTTSTDYIKYFHASDICIADTSSIIYEYLLTQKPIIALFSNECIHWSIFCRPLQNICYCPSNPEALENILLNLQNKNDWKKAARMEFIEKNFHKIGESAGYKIKVYIKEDFKRGWK